MRLRAALLLVIIVLRLVSDTTVLVTAQPYRTESTSLADTVSPLATTLMTGAATSGATILITNQGLNPGQVSIQAGDVITWVNQTDSTQRLVSQTRLSQLYLPLVSRDASSDQDAAAGGQVPSAHQAASFGADIPPGGRHSFTFNDTGDYPYFIADHPDWRGDVIVTPFVDPTVPTSLAAAVSFIYSGPNAIQTGMAPGTVEARRVAVLRGKVLTRGNAPLAGVKMTILNHPEYGQTLSRSDGMFDMVVNGGGLLTLNYVKEGYLQAQRQLDVPWQDYVWLPEVVMLPQDPQVTTIDLSAGIPIQVARGSVIADGECPLKGMCTRQATVFFPQGVTAKMVFASGVSQTLTTLHVRATEYTVGSDGPAAMPSELPANSGYTYATEFSVDEATAAGAVEKKAWHSPSLR